MSSPRGPLRHGPSAVARSNDGFDCNHLTTRLHQKEGLTNVIELRTLHVGASNYVYGRSGGPLALSVAAAAYGGDSRAINRVIQPNQTSMHSLYCIIHNAIVSNQSNP